MSQIDYSFFNNTNIDPFTSAIFSINHHSDGLWTILFLMLIMIVVGGVSYYRTQDLGKSSAISGLMTSFTAILLYYYGYNGGYSTLYTGEEFLSSVILFTVIITTAFLITGIKYFKKGS